MNESKTYYIKTVADTTFDPDAYGNKFYSVTIEGIEGGILWKTKNRPEAGPVYGHIEKSKSGKANIFKRDQKPEDYVEPTQPTYAEKLFNTPAVPIIDSKASESLPDMSQVTNGQVYQAIVDLTLLVQEIQLKLDGGE